MAKFYVYRVADKSYVVSFEAADLAAAEAFAARFYTVGGREVVRVSPRRLGAPWLSSAASARLRGPVNCD